MFVNPVQVISTRLDNISLDIDKMQPKAERPPVCPKQQLPRLHLTPSNTSHKRPDNPQQGSDNPWLLKPKHDMPATPPPQTQPQGFFPQRLG